MNYARAWTSLALAEGRENLRNSKLIDIDPSGKTVHLKRNDFNWDPKLYHVDTRYST